MAGMRKLDWANVRRYSVSGSPVFLLGAVLILLLHERHIISENWTWLMFVLVGCVGHLAEQKEPVSSEDLQEGLNISLKVLLTVTTIAT
jgi:hypothetical protein